MALEHRQFSSDCSVLETGCKVSYWDGTKWLNADEYGLNGKFSDGVHCYTVENGYIVSKVLCVIDTYVNLCAETDGSGFVTVTVRLQAGTNFIYSNYIDASVPIQVDFTVNGDQSNTINTVLTIASNSYEEQNTYQLFFVGENISSVSINSLSYTAPIGQNIYIGVADLCGVSAPLQDVYFNVCAPNFFRWTFESGVEIYAQFSNTFGSARIPVLGAVTINYTILYLNNTTLSASAVMRPNSSMAVGKVLSGQGQIALYDTPEDLEVGDISSITIDSIVPSSQFGQNYIVGTYQSQCCDNPATVNLYVNICCKVSNGMSTITMKLQFGTDFVGSQLVTNVKQISVSGWLNNSPSYVGSIIQFSGVNTSVVTRQVSYVVNNISYVYVGRASVVLTNSGCDYDVFLGTISFGTCGEGEGPLP